MELLPSGEAPTEAHKIGKQIEVALPDARERDEKVRNAAKVRRSKLRNKKPPLEASLLAEQIRASEAKWIADRTALWSTLVDIELPEGVVEVKRVRPPPPPPTLMETEARLRAAVQAAPQQTATSSLCVAS